jgi:hypothetical protein
LARCKGFSLHSYLDRREMILLPVFTAFAKP